MKLTSEEFASKMIEGFEPRIKPVDVTSNIERAEKVEEKMNQEMKKKIENILNDPDAISDDSTDDEPEVNEIDESNENDESEEKII